MYFGLRYLCYLLMVVSARQRIDHRANVAKMSEDEWPFRFHQEKSDVPAREEAPARKMRWKTKRETNTCRNLLDASGLWRGHFNEACRDGFWCVHQPIHQLEDALNKRKIF